MQTSLELFPNVPENNDVFGTPEAGVKASLENYIAVCGLVAYKDFYMKIKYGQIENIPESITRAQYLDLAKEVYQSRAGRVERQKSKAKYFAVRNRIKKQQR
ncbi:hypothetical protein SAMN05192574_101358 [Mucilaginibacter gossypiicola]|uniref:Uncharacterized protein n=1 Tax=Mucilaginibacter gossypiicola TaxID=551995 RepID=A0A1H8A715_9SPHI|nr:hypothetical protein [Mucilaginibacter gossypiicola]SEM65684.1 hypothetical protein SAMN05192574_101358 [Mucilaginibacter gossypiicola]